MRVPPPRRTLRWRPPESAAAGRVVFGAAGALLGVLCLAATRFASFHVLAAAGVVTLIVVVRVVKARRSEGPRWRPVSLLVGAVVVPLLLVVGEDVGPRAYEWARRRPFDQVAWRTALPGDDLRFRMVVDLVSQRPTRGLHRDAVHALLGPPDTAEFHPFRPGNRRIWRDIWILSPQRKPLYIEYYEDLREKSTDTKDSLAERITLTVIRD